jgi:putative ABC transport system permease protein
MGGYYFILPVSNMNLQVVDGVQKLFAETFPGQPFDHFFLTEKYGSQYSADEKFGKIISLFLTLLLVITCSGLFSLASYSAKFRTKEIGIRKVMGASVNEVVLLVLKEYVVIVLAAIVIGSPLAFLAVDNWLKSFSMRIEIQWWMFALPAAMVMVIALLTVMGQTLRAASANPTNTLKYE